MKSSPIISVAIITYNQVDFISDCIESVLNQSYSNIEINIADDASTDGTQEIIKNYQKNIPSKLIVI